MNAQSATIASNQSRLPEEAPYPGSERHPWNIIPLGLGTEGEITWDTLTVPHALISGVSGSGKSIVQRSIIFHCIQHSDKWDFIGIDLTQVELTNYEKYSATVRVTTTLEGAVATLQSVYDEMMDRYTEMRNQGATHFNELPNPPKALMLMVDEASHLMFLIGGNSEDAKKDDNLRFDAKKLITKIAKMGRAAGVHIVLGTQVIDTSVISRELRNNINLRYAAGRTNHMASSILFGSDIGTHIASHIRGRAVVQIHGADQFIQGYYTTPDWLDSWIAKDISDSK